MEIKIKNDKTFDLNIEMGGEKQNIPDFRLSGSLCEEIIPRRKILLKHKI